MEKNLLIVESPTKAKTLKKYLGNEYEIMASFGPLSCAAWPQCLNISASGCRPPIQLRKPVYLNMFTKP